MKCYAKSSENLIVQLANLPPKPPFLSKSFHLFSCTGKTHYLCISSAKNKEQNKTFLPFNFQNIGRQLVQYAASETAMHEDLDLCYQNWSTPLAAAELMEIFRREPLFAQEYQDFIYQTMVECKTGQDRLVAPLADKGVVIGHKTGTGDLNAKGQQIGCNDIGFVLLPDGRTYSIAVFVKDSEESFAENSKIIADISRIVYEYMMQSAK